MTRLVPWVRLNAETEPGIFGGYECPDEEDETIMAQVLWDRTRPTVLSGGGMSYSRVRIWHEDDIDLRPGDLLKRADGGMTVRVLRPSTKAWDYSQIRLGFTEGESVVGAL